MGELTSERVLTVVLLRLARVSNYCRCFYPASSHHASLTGCFVDTSKVTKYADSGAKSLKNEGPSSFRWLPPHVTAKKDKEKKPASGSSYFEYQIEGLSGSLKTITKNPLPRR
jgi:hypothetical protein